MIGITSIDKAASAMPRTLRPGGRDIQSCDPPRYNTTAEAAMYPYAIPRERQLSVNVSNDCRIRIERKSAAMELTIASSPKDAKAAECVRAHKAPAATNCRK